MSNPSKTTESGLFAELEPQPGGLAQLRGRLDRLEGRRVLGRRLAIVAACLVPLIFIAVRTWAPGGAPRVEPAHLDLELTRMRLGLGGADPPAMSVRLDPSTRHTTAVAEVSSSPEVIFYYVGEL